MTCFCAFLTRVEFWAMTKSLQMSLLNPLVHRCLFGACFAFEGVKYLLVVQSSQFKTCSAPKHALDDTSIKFQSTVPAATARVGVILREVKWREISLPRGKNSPGAW